MVRQQYHLSLRPSLSQWQSHSLTMPVPHPSLHCFPSPLALHLFLAAGSISFRCGKHLLPASIIIINIIICAWDVIYTNERTNGESNVRLSVRFSLSVLSASSGIISICRVELRNTLVARTFQLLSRHRIT